MRCNGCGVQHSGRVCYVCESARSGEFDDEPTGEPEYTAGGAPKWFVALFFFLLGALVAFAMYPAR